jgi:hypothetical protein
VSETEVSEVHAGETAHCQVCDLRSEASADSLIYADHLWTVAVGFDVPGWFMVSLNRHNVDWFMGLSDDEAVTLGPLTRSLGIAARAEASAERVYLMGFGEQWSHFHFMVMSRGAAVATEHRGPGLLARAPELADRDEAIRVAAKVRHRLGGTT